MGFGLLPNNSHPMFILVWLATYRLREREQKMENKYKSKKIKGKKIDEHRLVWENYWGYKLKPEEVIHHIDRNKANNDINNLKYFKTKSEHTKFHYENGDYELKAGENKKKLINEKLQCYQCKRFKPLKDFQKRKTAHLGVVGICLDCRNIEVAEYKVSKKHKRK